MGSPAKVYDVFLSHSSADKPAVEKLARKLRDEGLQPFLDKWHLIPGEPWQEALEKALEQSRTCAVFLGPRGIGPWENEEMRAALDQRVRDQDQRYRVIPVLLPGAQAMPKRGSLPGFLSRLTWVDFRWNPDDGDQLHRLVCGIRGVAPGASRSEAAATDRCPYRGLEPFREEDADLFFGRGSLVQRLVDHLRDNRFLAVVGPSGSGKSSVVRAGLIPALSHGALPGSDRWKRRVMVPDARPVTTLSADLAEIFDEVAPGQAPHDSLELEDKLRASSKALHSLVVRAFKDRPEQERLLIVVDQLEEIFTLCEEEAERRAFLENLLDASGLPRARVTVVVTLRADFYARATAYPELGDRLSDDQEVIPPMVRAELREAIEMPTSLAGLEFDERLPAAILEDVQGQDGELPLLQHTLLELWKRRRGRRLTFEAYHEIGGVKGALTHRAEEVYTGLAKKERELARHVLLHLVRPGEGTEDTRRRARLEELISQDFTESEVESVVHQLADARLLSTDFDRRLKEEVVSVAHEALIRSWRRLKEWIEAEREVLRFHNRLSEKVEEWERLGRDSGSLLAGAQLREARKWTARHGKRLSHLEREFLNASRRRASLRIAAGLAGALLVLSFVWTATRQVQIKELKSQLVQSGSAEALEPLRRLTVDYGIDPKKLHPFLEDMDLIELFEKGPGKVGVPHRGEAVLSAARAAIPLLEDSSDKKTIQILGAILWALDYFPARVESLKAEAQVVRSFSLSRWRQTWPPPDLSSIDWAEVDAFHIMAHEVTNRDYRRLFPDHLGEDDFPAVNVDWYHAYVYSAWLGGRLPTRAEWERAARADCSFEYCRRDGSRASPDDVAWYSENSGDTLHPIAQLEPNPAGLFDMYGNASEWITDWHPDNPEEMDLWGPPTGRNRIVCGGSFEDEALELLQTSRARPNQEPDEFGFRVVRVGIADP